MTVKMLLKKAMLPEVLLAVEIAKVCNGTSNNLFFYDVIFKGEPLICADPDEMDMYFGVLVMMSIIKFPQIRMYWLRETRVPLWQMSC